MSDGKCGVVIKAGSMPVTGIWLRREGNDAVVLFERDGLWIEAIREECDGNFSHITEVGGMSKLSREAAEAQGCPAETMGHRRKLAFTKYMDRVFSDERCDRLPSGVIDFTDKGV